MKILEEIKKEHDEIKDYFLQMENEPDKAPEIFDELATFVLTHHETEEEVVFSKLSRKKDTKELKNNLIAEHQSVRVSAQAVLSTDPESDDWEARCHVFQDILTHHTEEEESELFKTLREELEEPELDALQAEFEKKFEELKPDLNKKVTDRKVMKEEDYSLFEGKAK